MRKTRGVQLLSLGFPQAFWQSTFDTLHMDVHQILKLLKRMLLLRLRILKAYTQAAATAAIEADEATVATEATEEDTEARQANTLGLGDLLLADAQRHATEDTGPRDPTD